MVGRPITYGEAELHRSVGELDGKVDMLIEQQNRILAKMEEVGDRVSKVEKTVSPIPDVIASHSNRIMKLELFDGKIAAVVMIIGTAAGAAAMGLWQIIVNFNSVMSFARRLFGAGP